MRWARHAARMGEKKNAYKLLVGKPEGKMLLGRLRRKWIILRWIFKSWDGVIWTGKCWEPTERESVSTKLHGLTSHKTVILISGRKQFPLVASITAHGYSRKHSVYPYTGVSHRPVSVQTRRWSPMRIKSWLHSKVTLVPGTKRKLLLRPNRGVSRTPHDITET
jgi:hypothetical protein